MFRSVLKVTHNVSGLYEGGELKHKTMNEERMLIQSESYIRSTKPPLLYSPCYVSVIILNFF
jgi:hypothetical protein